MRHFALTAAALLATALPAHAASADPVQAAFDLLSTHSVEQSGADYTKLSANLSMAEAGKIDAQLSTLLGEPAQTREGLKVWEVDGATIMCGPDGRGGVYISADRRTAQSAPLAVSGLTKVSRTKRQDRPRPALSLRSGEPVISQAGD